MVQSTATSRTARRGQVSVRLAVPPGLGCTGAEVAGEFTLWSPLAMGRDDDGGFSLAFDLPRGRTWHYRFRLDGERWINDPVAAEFVLCPDCGAISVLHT